jgi:hypothetical protein
VCEAKPLFARGSTNLGQCRNRRVRVFGGIAPYEALPAHQTATRRCCRHIGALSSYILTEVLDLAPKLCIVSLH